MDYLPACTDNRVDRVEQSLGQYNTCTQHLYGHIGCEY